MLTQRDVRRCATARRRGVIGACSALTGLGCGKGQGVDRMSLCDGRGCLRQLASVSASLRHPSLPPPPLLPPSIPRPFAPASVCAPPSEPRAPPARPQEGGAWLKHTGHQHWRDPVPECMPLSKDEADEQLERVAC